VNQKEGIVVADTVPGSPAERVGLQQGDVIVAVDKQQLHDESDLARLLSKHKPGDQVTLSVVRNNKTRDVQVKLAEMQSS
jgi:S1-C subfamily serine protease